MNSSQALSRCITCLLDNATADATWTDFQVEWNPIITTLTCKLLLLCGLSLDTPWHADRSNYSRCTLIDSMKWLNNAVRPDGSFGTDFWDAIQLAILIEAFSLHSRFTAYGSLKKLLMATIRSRDFSSDPSQWQGPGFIAAAIEYLRLLGNTHDARLLSGELVQLQRTDGSWPGNLDPSGSPIVSPVWHTSQSIIVLASDPSAHRESVNKGIKWLCKAQHESGAWLSVQQYNIYFTAYAVLALVSGGQHDDAPLRQGIEYLKSQMSADGKCSDLGGTLMCALALRAVVGNEFEKDVTLVDYLLAKKNLSRAKALEVTLQERDLELVRVQAELDRYEKKYRDADFVITKKELFLITMVGLFLAVLGTVAGVYGLNAFVHPNSPVVAPSVEPTGRTAPEVLPPDAAGSKTTIKNYHPSNESQ